LAVIERDSLADRIFIAKVDAGKVVVDDGSPRRIAFVSIVKIASFDQADTKRLEITWTNAPRVNDHLFSRFRLGLSFDAEVRTGKLQGQWESSGGAGRPNAGQRFKPLERFLEKSGLLTILGIPGPRK